MVDYFKYIIDLLINSKKEKESSEEKRPFLEIDAPIEFPEGEYDKDKKQKKNKKSSVIIIDI